MKKVSPVKASLIFIIVTIYFYLLLFILLPLIKANFLLNPALYWFIIGYFLFIPIFFYALLMIKIEGNKGIKKIFFALNIKPFTRKEWIYSIVGLLLVFIFSGLIFGISILLNRHFGVRELSTVPWFMQMRPFEGVEKLYLLIWLPMFFFNIVGEEILWRGYIQSRLQGKYSWILCSLLWMVFHLPFGFDLLIILIPVIIIIPYIFYRTKNTLVGIFIHGIYNGPIFIAVALGILR